MCMCIFSVNMCVCMWVYISFFFFLVHCVAFKCKHVLQYISMCAYLISIFEAEELKDFGGMGHVKLPTSVGNV